MWKIIAISAIVTIHIKRLGVHADPLVPCFFVFGDSLFDAGNNNALNTKAKANYPPYGVDYLEGKATGRFTNGRTMADIIVEHLGLQGYIEPHSTAKGPELLKGVNYASGSAGIRPETAQHLGERIYLAQQVLNHKSVIKKLEGLVDNGDVMGHLNKCLYGIYIGSNDYINNYFMPKTYPTSRKYNYDQFAAELINEYAKQIKVLYENGARKIALFGLSFVGCSLAEVSMFRPRGPCVNEINVAVGYFNNRLKFLVDKLTPTLPGARIIFINNQAIQFSPFQAIQLGLTVPNKPCCLLREDFQCREKTTSCINRNNYVFYDGFHPTEAVNRITGDRAFRAATPLDAYPYDISRLVSS